MVPLGHLVDIRDTSSITSSTEQWVKVLIMKAAVVGNFSGKPLEQRKHFTDHSMLPWAMDERRGLPFLKRKKAVGY